MADQTASSQGGTGTPGLVIPAETLTKFSDLIALIKGSESMNDEERQYWVNILPIMTPEQVQNLREILQTEKSQLQAIDEKYATEIRRMGEQELVRQTEDEYRKRRQTRQSSEQRHRETEEVAAEDLLRKIEGA